MSPTVMKLGIAAGSALVLAGLVACTGPSLSPSASSSPSHPSVVVAKYVGFQLTTHCGIRSAVVGGAYYVADPMLSDGRGNPPPGWGNPFQKGVMTVRSDGSAEFVAGSLRAGFVAGTKPQSPFLCD